MNGARLTRFPLASSTKASAAAAACSLDSMVFDRGGKVAGGQSKAIIIVKTIGVW
jgi:hypothetical protein